MAFRARSPATLARRAAALEASDRGIVWVEGNGGHGPAYRFHDPDGHVLEISDETA